jgi:hypothetical protein
VRADIRDLTALDTEVNGARGLLIKQGRGCINGIDDPGLMIPAGKLPGGYTHMPL